MTDFCSQCARGLHKPTKLHVFTSASLHLYTSCLWHSTC